MPELRLAVEAGRAADGAFQHRLAHRGELQAGAQALGDGHGIGVDHRVGQPADPRDHGQRPIAQRAELGEAAGLVARGHQQRIDAALDQMGEALVIADVAADAAGILIGGVAEAALQPALAGAQQGELGPFLQQDRQARPAEDRIPSAR